jgi:hypothetical protein
VPASSTFPNGEEVVPPAAESSVRDDFVATEYYPTSLLMRTVVRIKINIEPLLAVGHADADVVSDMDQT